MIGRVRESRNPKKVIRVSLRESYGEIRRVPVNLSQIITLTRKLNSEKSLTVIVKKKNTIKSYQKSQLKRKSYS